MAISAFLLRDLRPSRDPAIPESDPAIPALGCHKNGLLMGLGWSEARHGNRGATLA